MNFQQIFSEIIDDSRIVSAEQAGIYEPTTTGARRALAGALRPQTTLEIQGIVSVSRRHKIKLYPVSAGRNWGYSDSMPATDNNVIVDLSLMRDIRNYDPEMGTVTIEPGVTQQQLCDYLLSQGGHHVISVTGSSPEASIIGNYLERGFGLLPVMDHAYSVMSLKAVMGNGDIYQSPLLSCGADKSASLFRWGVGPYTDGLFFQSSFGIVSEMTIRLVRKAKSTKVCFIEVDCEQTLWRSLPVACDLREEWPLETLQLKILNGYYTLASMGIRHSDIASAGGYHEALKRYDVPPYTIMITLSGAAALTKAMVQDIRRRFSFSRRLIVLDERMIKMMRLAMPVMPAKMRSKIYSAQSLWSLLQGQPDKAMIGKIPYFRMAGCQDLARDHPAHDRCGIIWFALSLPLTRQGIEDFQSLAAYAERHFGFSPIINFTNYSHLSCIGLLAIVFDQDREKGPAQACYSELMKQGLEQGYFPYRLPLFAAHAYFDDHPLQFNRQLSDLLDPDRVFPRQC